jgi:hypothetical protein
MKKSLLALALFASAASAFAHDGDKPAAKGKKADHCSAAAAAKCEKGMTAGAKMAAMKTAPATAATKAPVKSM